MNKMPEQYAAFIYAAVQLNNNLSAISPQVRFAYHPKIAGMSVYSSGAEFAGNTRKSYTITDKSPTWINENHEDIGYYIITFMSRKRIDVMEHLYLAAFHYLVRYPSEAVDPRIQRYIHNIRMSSGNELMDEHRKLFNACHKAFEQ